MNAVFLLLRKWWEKDNSPGIVGFLVLGLLLAFTIRENFKNAESIQHYGVTIKAIVYDRSYAKGTYTFYIKFKYKENLYQNDCRSSKFSFNIGDSITVKINSKNPLEYCQVAQ